jgi:hypothetical protein
LRNEPPAIARYVRNRPKDKEHLLKNQDTYLNITYF